MDMYGKVFLDLWQSLNKRGVRYIMVGGFAVNLHGFHRYTGDVDLYIDDTLENRKRLREVFVDLDLGDFESLETMQFIPGWTDFQLNNGIRLDFMTSLTGVDISFSECFKLAPIAEIEGIMVPFLHINQLLENKRAVFGPKDQIDIIELEKIKEERKKMGLD